LSSFEIFEIYESKMNFNQSSFMLEVREEMAWLGVDSYDLEKMTYINRDRLLNLIRCRAKAKNHEIDIIKKKLNIT